MTIAMDIGETKGTGPLCGPVSRELEKILAGGIDIHRCQAARALGRIGDASATKTLTAALLDEDPDVRTDAAEALVGLADDAAAMQLMENLLGDPTGEVKIAAIAALAKRGDGEVVPWLRRIAVGRDEEIVWDDEEFFASGWDDWADVQAAAVRALGEMGITEAVPDIVATLAQEEAQDLTDTAFRALSRLGPEGIAALAGFLQSPYSRNRRRAATALGRSDDPQAGEALLRALGDSEPDVRRAALVARAETTPGDPGLMLLIDDPDPGVRAEAMRLVGAAYPQDLPSFIDDDDEAVALAALDHIAAGAIAEPGPALIEALAQKLTGADGARAARAARALGAIAPDDPGARLEATARNTDVAAQLRVAALNALGAIGGEGLADLFSQLLEDDRRSVRIEAATQLARQAASGPARGENEAAGLLLAALRGAYDPAPTDDEDGADEGGEPTPEADAQAQADAEENGDAAEAEEENTAHEAVTATVPTSTLDSILAEAPEIQDVVGLPERGEELSAEDMERLAIARNVLRKRKVSLEPKVLKHEDIRRFAARVLGDVARPDVLAALCETLATGDAELQAAAADSLARVALALGELPADRSAEVRAALNEAGRDARLPLVRALAVSGEDDAVHALEALLTDDDSFIRTEAVRSLSRRGHVCAQVRARLDDSDPSVRLATAEAIAAANGPGAVDQLVAFAIAYEGYHGRQAAEMAGKIDASRANDVFVKILNDPDQKRVWTVAIEGLEEINKS